MVYPETEDEEGNDAAPGMNVDKMLEEEEEDDDDYDPKQRHDDNSSKASTSSGSGEHDSDVDSERGSDESINDDDEGEKDHDKSNEESQSVDASEACTDEYGSEIQDDEVAALLKEAELDLGPGLVEKYQSADPEHSGARRVLRQRRPQRGSSQISSEMREFQMPSGSEDIGRPVAMLKGGVVRSGFVVGYTGPITSSSSSSSSSSSIPSKSFDHVADSIDWFKPSYWSLDTVKSFDEHFDKVVAPEVDNNSNNIEVATSSTPALWNVVYNKRKAAVSLTFDELV
jgi:hypothetical protein